MVKLKNSLLLLLGLIATIFGIASVTSRSSQGQNNDAGTRPVRVVNTTSEPIPVTGTTTIGGAVSLAQGTTVGISGSPTVQVSNASNSPLLERDVDNPARQPYQITMSNFPTPNPEIVVPAGKRLVIEAYSMYAFTPVGVKIPLASLATTANGVTVFHTVTPTFVTSAANSDHFEAHRQTRIYCDPGSTVSFLIGASNATAFFSISGYLVDVQ